MRSERLSQAMPTHHPAKRTTALPDEKRRVRMSANTASTSARATVAYLLILCCFPLSAQFRAGAARRDITPREPVPMWGYGDRHDKLSTAPRDPLSAGAWVSEGGGKKPAIVGPPPGRAPAERSLQ